MIPRGTATRMATMVEAKVRISVGPSRSITIPHTGCPVR